MRSALIIKEASCKMDAFYVEAIYVNIIFQTLKKKKQLNRIIELPG